MQPDKVDIQILGVLQQEGRITNSDLAARVGLTPGPTLARVNKLEAAGLIVGYTAIVDRHKLGLPITAFVSVILRTHNKAAADAFLGQVTAMPEVLECHHIAGEEDYLLKVVAASPADYERFVLEKLTLVADLQRVKTIFVLSSPKSTTEIPIGQIEVRE